MAGRPIDRNSHRFSQRYFSYLPSIYSESVLGNDDLDEFPDARDSVFDHRGSYPSSPVGSSHYESSVAASTRPSSFDSSSDLEPYPNTESLLKSKSLLMPDNGLPQPPTSSPRQRVWHNPLKWGKFPDVPTVRSICPEYGASLFSKITFSWMTPLMSVGYRRPLELNDIWLVNPDRKIDFMADKFKGHFRTRMSQGSKKPLLWAIHETFKHEFWIGGAAIFISSICQVMSPYTLRYLIEFVQEAFVAHAAGPSSDVPNPSIGKGLGFVFAIMILQFIQSLGTNQFIYHGFLVGGQARAVLITAIFDKTMTISNTAKARKVGSNAEVQPTLAEKEEFARKAFNAKAEKGGMKTSQPKPEDDTSQAWSNGKIMSLMATDTSRVDQAAGMFHLLWTSPFIIFLALFILLINITYSAMAGFSILFCGLPILVFAVKSLSKRRKGINKSTDARLSLTQEVLKSIRFVKYYGWESAFRERFMDIRREEISMTQKLLSIRNGINAFSFSLPIFASMIAFITYSVTGHVLTPARVFSSLSLFNALRIPFNLLPVVMGQVTDAWSSLRRIEEFLIAEDQQDHITWDMESNKAIVVNHADFTWQQPDEPQYNSSLPTRRLSLLEYQLPLFNFEQMALNRVTSSLCFDDAPRLTEEPSPVIGPLADVKSGDSFSLRNVNFSVGHEELVAVIGTVGSGKTSLLSGLAGDMRLSRGKVTLGGARAFCPQQAWIQNTTLRNNILFGKPFDKDWYDQVIYACALQPDLDMLPAGDKTEIGERGINLSGGQRQRLNLARAIYSNCDIVLMDDPLSAVDAHVGHHIFEKAICGLLRGRCRVLATHQLHVLARCDRIVWLEEGRVRAVDTFNNLTERSMKFRYLISSIAQREQSEGNEQKGQHKETEGRGEPSEKPAENDTLIQEEDRAVDSVPWSVYIDYIKSSGSLWFGLIPLVLLILSQCSNVATSLWLSWWTSNRFNLTRDQYIGIYVGLALTQALLIFAFSSALSILGTRASRNIFDRGLSSILKAPISFFDTTPLGRITNRFSKDVETMDNTIIDALRQYFFTLAMIVSVFSLFIVFFHWSGIALGPLLILLFFAAAYYRASAREVKRHEAVLRSTMFARFSEAITGVPSIRAYGLESYFSKNLRAAIDDMNSAYYLTFSNQRWLNTRLDVISNCLVLTTGILVVLLRTTINPAISGLVFSYMLSIVQMIQLLIRQLAEVENSINATERLQYYARELEQEPMHEGTVNADPSWPQQGAIKFSNVEMRYRNGLPLVLNGVDMQVKAGERLAIVGRTGAGKSSITSVLFRLTEICGGRITIDGMDIAKIPLQDLRSRLSIIPQDPALFQGTIRSNLDPFQRHTDLELWSALRQAHLTGDEASKEGRSSSRISLDTAVEEDGSNFSLGQRQLLALARALVRNSRVVICDEATSSVDLETDKKVQDTMRTSFKDKTLLVIAHRLRTVISYDRVCVMDKGRVLELGTPWDLWTTGGEFRGMCEQSGITEDDLTHCAFRFD